MPRELWWLWMIAAAAFTIGEIFTAGFFLLWFGIGAAAAGVLTLLGFGTGLQLLVFVALSLILFAASRRFAEKWTETQPSGVGADRLVGKRGVVLADVDNVKGTGHVKVEREQWRADSITGEVIPEGTPVEVERVEGTHLVVMIAKEEE